MIISALKSNDPKDHRSPIHPDTISALTSLKVEINFERGIGEGINSDDSVFENLGLKSFSRPECIEKSDLLITNQPISVEEISSMKKGSTLIGMVSPFSNQELINACAANNINLVSMEFIPRITRAQKMDVLSSQANIAGYKAVLIGSNHIGKYMPLLMTAAGTISPARTLVIGAGVAGLQAIATAKRLGSQVEAFDVRPEVKEQVESLGAKFIEVESNSDDGVGSGGYASETSDEYKAKQQELMKERVGKSDIVITTALIPNRPAPMLIPKSMVETMAPGSVIMDLASENGGNCELTQENEIVNHNGVLIDGNSNLPSTMAYHSSQLFSKNIEAIIDHCHSEEGFKLDKEDEIIDGMLFIENGEVRHQPTKESM